MTIEEKMQELLEAKGMFASDAKKVVTAAKESPVLKNMERRWSDDISGYQKSLLSTVWMVVRSVAKDWIEENCPKAWFRSEFADA